MTWRRGYLSAAIFVLHWSAIIEAFAYWMENSYCDRDMTPGTVIMNRRAVQSPEGRVRVFRGSDHRHELKSHELYVSGEQVMVQLELGSGEAEAEVVFETDGGTFLAGGCGGRRSCRPGALLQLPVLNEDADDGTAEEVLIWAGWASTHGVVQISDVFSLLPMTDENIQVAVMRAEGHLPAATPASHRPGQEQEQEGVREVVPATEGSLSGRLRGRAMTVRNIGSDEGWWSLLLLYGLLVAAAACLILLALGKMSSRRFMRRGKTK